MADQGLFQSSQYSQTLLAQRREIASRSCLLDSGFDLLLYRFQLLGTALDHSLQRAYAHRGSQQVLSHFTGALIRLQLLLHQIDTHRSKRRSILHRRSHVLRKRRGTDLLTARAALPLGLVFDHYDPLGRQIKHLATFHLQALHCAQVSLIVLTELHRVDNHLIGRWRQHQCPSWMTRLPSGLLAAIGLVPAARIMALADVEDEQEAFAAIMAIALNKMWIWLKS